VKSAGLGLCSVQWMHASSATAAQSNILCDPTVLSPALLTYLPDVFSSLQMHENSFFLFVA